MLFFFFVGWIGQRKLIEIFRPKTTHAHAPKAKTNDSATLISMMIWANVCILSVTHSMFGVVYRMRRWWTLQFVPNLVPLVRYNIECYCTHLLVCWYKILSLADACNGIIDTCFCFLFRSLHMQISRWFYVEYKLYLNQVVPKDDDKYCYCTINTLAIDQSVWFLFFVLVFFFCADINPIRSKYLKFTMFSEVRREEKTVAESRCNPVTVMST